MRISSKISNLLRVLLCGMPIGICLSAALCSSATKLRPQDSSTSATDQRIAVRISAKNKTLHPGESLVLHVEIINQGSKDVFILKEIKVGCCAWSELRIYVQHGPPFETPGVGGSIEDSLRLGANNPNKPPFSNALSRAWIALPPGYSYCKDLDTYALRIPGVYRIAGTYTSHGISGELKADYGEEIRHLPYQAWEGQVETNSIWIKVAKPSKQEKRAH